VKALSVRQPWAELIAQGRKTLELRSWRTDYRGPLLICSGAAWHPEGAALHGRIGDRGVAVCVVDLVDVRQFVPRRDALAACVVRPDARSEYAWVLEKPRRTPPAPVKGRLMLFDVVISQ